MKRTCLFLLAAAALFMGSCKSSGSDAEIATGMCGCFNMLKDSLPPEAIGVFQKAAAAENPQEVFTKELQNLDPSIALKVNAALMSTAKTGSPINDCLKELDKKFKSPSSDEQEVAKKMVAALKDKKDCDIMLALMRMSLKK
jgi:translation elongation factor EF-4